MRGHLLLAVLSVAFGLAIGFCTKPLIETSITRVTSDGVVLPDTPEMWMIHAPYNGPILLFDTESNCAMFYEGTLKLCRDGRFFRGEHQIGDDPAIAEALVHWARAFNFKWRE